MLEVFCSAGNTGIYVSSTLFHEKFSSFPVSKICYGDELLDGWLRFDDLRGFACSCAVFRFDASLTVVCRAFLDKCVSDFDSGPCFEIWAYSERVVPRVAVRSITLNKWTAESISVWCGADGWSSLLA